MPLVRRYEEEAIANGDADSWPSFDNYPPKAELGISGSGSHNERRSKRLKPSR